LILPVIYACLKD